jgi:hypothetical protein
LRQALEERLAQLSVEVDSLFAEARDRGRREFADLLNQSVRRICQAGDLEELGAALFDAAGVFSSGSALFRIAGETARGEAIRGVPRPAVNAFRALEIPLSSAAALAGAVESRDPVMAAATPGEVSADLVKLAGHPPDSRVSIFPVVVRERVPALVYAWGTVQGSAIELLAQVAAAMWSALSGPEPEVAPPDLVTIEPAAPVPAAPAPAAAAAPDEPGPLHLRARRFARVEVAKLCLFEAGAVRAGRAQRNLYEALRNSIDAARETFRQSFLAPCPGIPDYLHLELVRTLANDDPELLGKTYPGPLV